MLDSNFINGFATELVTEKRAAHPLNSVVSHKGGNLGRKIKGMVSRKTKLGKTKRFRMKKRAEAAAPPDVKPPAQANTPQLPKPAAAVPPPQQAAPMTARPGQNQESPPVPASGPPVGERKLAAAQVIKKVLNEARPGTQPRPKGLGAQVLDQGAADTEYGGGIGNFEGRQAKPYTDTDNPVDNKKAGLGKQAPATKTASKARAARKAGSTLKKVLLGSGAVVGGAAAYENRDKIKAGLNKAKGDLKRAGANMKQDAQMYRREQERRRRKDRALNRVGL
jgi:hypothetical protein